MTIHAYTAELPPQVPLNPNADAYGVECLRRSEAALSHVTSHLNIPYGDDYWQKVDVFAPRNVLDQEAMRTAAHDPLPVVLFFHGGGWTHGYKEWCAFMAPAIVSTPAIFVSVSYRLLPAVAFPAPYDDAYAALAWVYNHIAHYGGDPDRLHVAGHSAGGQLACTLAVRSDLHEHIGLPGGVIKGCFSISTTFNRRTVNEAIAPHLVTNEDPEAVSPESAMAFVHQTDVPFLITWGGKEAPRYDTWSRKMIAALRDARCPVAGHRFADRDHFSIHLGTEHVDDPWTVAVRHFLQFGTFHPGLNDE